MILVLFDQYEKYFPSTLEKSPNVSSSLYICILKFREMADKISFQYHHYLLSIVPPCNVMRKCNDTQALDI